jgi:hypothetical protein
MGWDGMGWDEKERKRGWKGKGSGVKKREK